MICFWRGTMEKIMNWLEQTFSPAMNKINHNVWIITLKDSINQVMPLIFLGSIFSMLTLPGSVFGWTWWPDFWTPQGWTMEFPKQKDIRNNP